MSSDVTVASSPTRSRFRFRFSLLALLLLITLICMALGWWKFVHLERQRFILRRNVLTQHIQDMSTELKRKSEVYHDIAMGMGTLDSDGEKDLQKFDLRRLDRIDQESMRLEDQIWELQAKGASSELENRKQRLAQLRKQHDELKKSIYNRGRRSVDLESRRVELEHLQHMINEFSEELERINVEAEVRGIPTK